MADRGFLSPGKCVITQQTQTEDLQETLLLPLKCVCAEKSSQASICCETASAVHMPSSGLGVGEQTVQEVLEMIFNTQVEGAQVPAVLRAVSTSIEGGSTDLPECSICSAGSWAER